MENITHKSYIKTLGSGSSGNCYVLYDSRGKFIILDMGLPFNEILKGISYDIENVSFALATHNHIADHTKSINNLINIGIQVYGNEDICLNYKHCNKIEKGKKYKIDGFFVQTFSLVHNKPNNAFIIDTIDGIRILYCTDTKYIPLVVNNVNCAMIECNHDDDVILENFINESYTRSHPEFHQSLEECVKYLKRIYSPKLINIMLIHLSESNSDKEKFKNIVKNELGLPVYIAKKNLIVELNNSEF